MSFMTFLLMFTTMTKFVSAGVVGAEFQLQCSIDLTHRFKAHVYLLEESTLPEIVLSEAIKEARWDSPSHLSFELFSDDLQDVEGKHLEIMVLIKHNCEEKQKGKRIALKTLEVGAFPLEHARPLTKNMGKISLP
ncbi:unnamed protein product [Cylicocyclus nassatus]|uniref:Uncharacterized protein n=1 Tax=Cylicocyclus nassatus TaxID=53992 RepID=A0AA36M2T6_CYLNA|nr:unnamed protein product [Cylicocyclus nassatus]